MAIEVKVEGSFLSALKKFKKIVNDSGLTRELKERRFYKKPCEKRNEKKLKAIKRQRKKLARRREKIKK